MGMLTGITGYASSIQYHPNLMLKQLLNGNGVTWTQAIADGLSGRPLDAMARPYSIGITGASSSWSLGPYSYDGAGNIKSITAGALSETYVYDKVLRMTSGTIVTGGVNRTQTAQYSPYGFITTLTTNGTGQSFSEVAGTNRVSGMCYDNAGSVYGWGGTCGAPTYSYTWDPLKQMASTFGSGFTKRTFLYTADGERIEERVGSDPLNPASIVVSARGLDGKVLRLLTKNGTWSWTKDYVYRDGAQLATIETGSVTKYLHLDHLGTIRRITNTASPAAIIASHDYYPFGLEATSPSQDAERMKWTGHERDQQGTPSVQTDDLDYMHARYYNPNIARFLSTDPKVNVKRALRQPQNWNRYTYGLNNPLKLVDPTGEDVAIRLTFVGDQWTDEMKKQVIAQVRAAWLQMKVGSVWVLDAAKSKALKGPGTGNISIDTQKATSRPGVVHAGAVLAEMGKGNVGVAAAAAAIANLVNHEVFTHQLGLVAIPELRSSGLAEMQAFANPTNDPAILARQGTLVDTMAWERVRGWITSGPLDVYRQDLERAQAILGPINLVPTLGEPNE
jgi:RHS repeat-associated protein